LRLQATVVGVMPIPDPQGILDAAAIEIIFTVAIPTPVSVLSSYAAFVSRNHSSSET
jgi:hypothetical protein